MNQNKLETISNLFEGKEIRSIWDSEKEEYYFSVVDVISSLTDSDYTKARNYWKWLKGKLNDEGSQLVSITNQLKMKAKDGSMALLLPRRLRDCNKFYVFTIRGLSTGGILLTFVALLECKVHPCELQMIY